MNPKTPTPQPNYQDLYKGYYDPLAGEVDKYVDELISQANGDYDHAAKWIENNYKVAVGSDDKARQDLLKKVASTLEEKVGRIGFDFETGTYRLDADAARQTQRLTAGTELALRRLAEDEQVLKSDLTRQSDRARQDQMTGLNARGLISASRDEQGGLAGQEIRELDTDIEDRFSALGRAIGRDRENISLDQRYGLEDISLAKSRGLEDLTTATRRGAIDAGNQRQQGLDEAHRRREEAKRLAEAERRSSKNQLAKYADYYARGAGGLS